MSLADDWPVVDRTARWTTVSATCLEGEAAAAALGLDDEWREILGMTPFDTPDDTA